MISVCIATYNGEKYIEEQLRSILCQIGEEDEVVLSDDGSSDRTLEIVTALKDDRIKLFHHKKEQAPVRFRFDYTTRNFNFAIQQAKGDYIFLADQDDVWLPRKVEVTMKVLQRADIAISDCKVTDGDLNVVLQSRFGGRKQSVGLMHNTIKPGNPGCCMAFNKRVAEKIMPIPPCGVAQDVWFAVLGNMYFPVEFIYEPLILFRRHEGNVSSSMGKSHDSVSYRLSYRWVTLKEIVKHAGLWRTIRNL